MLEEFRRKMCSPTKIEPIRFTELSIDLTCFLNKESDGIKLSGRYRILWRKVR